MQKLTYDQMLKMAQNPRFKVVDFKKVNTMKKDVFGNDIISIEFINPPQNYSLAGDPIEPENVALLEDLDYVTV